MNKKEKASVRGSCKCKKENQGAGAFRFLPFFRLSAADVAPLDLGCPLTALVFEALSGAWAVVSVAVVVLELFVSCGSSMSSIRLRISRSRVVSFINASSFFSFSLETSLYRTVCHLPKFCQKIYIDMKMRMTYP